MLRAPRVRFDSGRRSASNSYVQGPMPAYGRPAGRADSVGLHDEWSLHSGQKHGIRGPF